MRKRVMKLTKFVSFAVLLSVFTITACSDVAGPNDSSMLMSEEYTGESNFTLAITSFESASCIAQKSADLKASKSSIDAGNVTYSMSGSEITVTYNAKSGWGIAETHVWVGNDLEDMPAAGNNAPKNGRFPYSKDHDPAVTTFTYNIPLDDVGISGGDDVYIVAHAVVGEIKGGSIKKTETAYAGNNKGESPRWWWYIHETTDEFCELDGGGIE